MEFVVRKHVTQDELRAGRARLAPGHTRDVLFQAVTTEDLETTTKVGDTATFETPKPAYGRRDARVVVDALNARQDMAMTSLANKPPAWWGEYVAHIRATNPGLVGSMTDEEIVRTIRTRAHEAAVERVFKKRGHGGVTLRPS